MDGQQDRLEQVLSGHKKGKRNINDKIIRKPLCINVFCSLTDSPTEQLCRKQKCHLSMITTKEIKCFSLEGKRQTGKTNYIIDAKW